MAKKQFKAESKRLLDLMINSIYTHKEIFLREIISNASDACDKLCYQALTDDSVKLTRKDFKIDLSVNKDARTITVTDNGIGMDKEDLENNLGVIASSGSYKFKQEVGDDTKDTDVIGQFGVGFYSAFMVCDQVTVRTRKFGSDTAYQWQSSGADGYTVTECDKSDAGTEVIMHLKDDTEDEHYSEFLEEWKLRELIKKYSDYIRFPIRMAVTKTKKVASCMSDKPDEVPYVEMETLNSMVPIWQRKKADVKPEEYNEFYREKFHDFADPQRVITVSAEGAVTYKALLFIPGTTPFDFYQYWRNVGDADVLKCIRMLTFLPLEQIDAMDAWEGSQLNQAKEILAYELTKLVHGEAEADKAQEAARALFGGSGSSENMPSTQLPAARFTDGKIGAIELLVACGLCASNGEARRLIQQGGVAVNDQKVASIDVTFDQAQFAGDGVVIKKGKKVFHRAYTA